VQNPSVHGTSLQHACVALHACPYCEQEPGVLPQVPCDAPGGRLHGRPEQQSAPVVHAPPLCTQEAAQTKPNSVPGVGTHGLPQQSALDAHVIPGVNAQGPAAAAQRGMPRLSWWHVSFCSTLPAQQFAFALHEFDCRRQIAPAGEHELPLSQRPSAKPGSLRHVTFDSALSGLPGPPQQSLSFPQTSPVGRQPLGG